MNQIIQGVSRFENEIFPRDRDAYLELVTQPQRPQALFITCADSRLNPNTFTGTRPGKLFILRNAGNIVPPYGSTGASGEAATIEYALTVLQIKNIILCGHSHCGAMRALLEGKLDNNMPCVRNWFQHSESTRRICAPGENCENGEITEETVLEAVKENVIHQLDHLRTHPAVAVGLSRNELNIYGWVYHLAEGRVMSFDPDSGEFGYLTECGAKALPSYRGRRSIVA